MKVVVTGSNGLLGQKILQELSLAEKLSKEQIIGFSKGNCRVDDHFFTYESVDLTLKTQVMQLLEKHRPTHIIHTAALTNVDYCELHQKECWKANVDAVSYLIEACEKYHIHLVHISTDFIFDGEKGSLYVEQDQPNPISYYGQSKLTAEDLVAKSTISYAILRTILVYGVSKDMSRSNIVLWVKSSLEKGHEINVVTDQFRTPTLAEDLAKACVQASKKAVQGIFHIGGPEYMSIYQIAHQVADFFELNKALINSATSSDIKQPAQRPPKTGFDISKARKELNYQPKTFKEGLTLVREQLRLA